MVATDSNTIFAPLVAERSNLMTDEDILTLEEIENDAAKIQAICRLSIDPSDNKTAPDVQTALYVIADYANKIKTVASKVMM